MANISGLEGSLPLALIGQDDKESRSYRTLKYFRRVKDASLPGKRCTSPMGIV